MPKKYEIFPYLASFLAEAHKDSSGGVLANKSKLSPMQNTLSRNYLCQKIVKGGGKNGFSETPKIGKLDIFKERYKCWKPLVSHKKWVKREQDRKVYRCGILRP